LDIRKRGANRFDWDSGKNTVTTSMGDKTI
jgi:hypothetical protein